MIYYIILYKQLCSEKKGGSSSKLPKEKGKKVTAWKGKGKRKNLNKKCEVTLKTKTKTFTYIVSNSNYWWGELNNKENNVSGCWNYITFFYFNSMIQFLNNEFIYYRPHTGTVVLDLTTICLTMIQSHNSLKKSDLWPVLTLSAMMLLPWSQFRRLATGSHLQSFAGSWGHMVAICNLPS